MSGAKDIFRKQTASDWQDKALLPHKLRSSLALVLPMIGVMGLIPAQAADLTLRPSYSASESMPLRLNILDANNELNVDFMANGQHYLESSEGYKQDNEQGWQTGVSVSASVMRDLLTPNLYLFGRFEWSKGTTDYKGALSSYPVYGSYTAKTDATITNEDFRIGKGFGLTDGSMYTPYIGFGARQWIRSLQGAYGYDERYTHEYVGVGLLAQFVPTDRWVLSFNGLIGSTLSPEMTASSNGGAAIPRMKFDLKRSIYYQAGLGVDYAMTRHLHANAAIDYEGYKYGSSEVNSYNLYEPSSNSDNVKLKAGLGLSF